VTPRREDIARAVEAIWEDSVVPALARYVELPCLSPAFDPDWESRGAIGDAVELARAWVAGRGVENASVEVARLPGRTPVLLLELGPTGPGRRSTTLLYGHLDKQPALGTWREGLEPFRAVREGDRLYGRGTADDGYAVFAAVSAAEACRAAGGGHGRVLVLVEASEESGSRDLSAYLDALSGRLGSPDVVVCLDSGCADYDRLWTTTSLRGNVTATLRVDVLREGVHSGDAGGVVPSSFRLLRALLSRVEDERTGAILLPELVAEVPEVRRREAEALVAELGPAAAGAFPVVPGLELAGRDLLERVLLRTWAPALEVTGIDGLPAVRDAGNVLRPFTAAKVSVRTPPTVDPFVAASALERAFTLAPPAGASVTFDVDSAGAGFDAPPLSPALADALDAASLAYFGRPRAARGEGGTIPFLATLARRYPAAQFVVTGVLGPGSNAHGPNESLHLTTAKRLTAALAQLLDALG
jgi:acetylornithine deacetylase/succinyl-diaminopimelate desuccinylase-like protein